MLSLVGSLVAQFVGFDCCVGCTWVASLVEVGVCLWFLCPGPLTGFGCGLCLESGCCL